MKLGRLVLLGLGLLAAPLVLDLRLLMLGLLGFCSRLCRCSFPVSSVSMRYTVSTTLA
jgi:hypothetical protein